MKKSVFVASALAFAAVAAVPAAAAPRLASPEIGAPAPAFEATTSGGETVSLSEFRGRTVVLEWTNDGCPFVQKHYDTGNMQATQEAVGAAGGVWLTVISSAPGKQGHVDGARADELTTARDAAPSHVLLDESGEIGAVYGAKTTPHMYVIDGDGVLRYAGAIDDRPSADPKTVEGAENFALAAFNSVKAGESVETPSTKPYGCSVKYGS